MHNASMTIAMALTLMNNEFILSQAQLFAEWSGRGTSSRAWR